MDVVEPGVARGRRHRPPVHRRAPWGKEQPADRLGPDLPLLALVPTLMNPAAVSLDGPRSTPTQSTSRDLYPHRDVGAVLLILAVLLWVFAALLGGTCTMVQPGGPVTPVSSGGSSCFYPYAGGAVLLGFLGLVFLILGIILVTTRASANGAYTAYGTPYWAGYPAPHPPPQLLACRNCGRVYSVGIYAFCPACGTKLGP